MIDIWANNNKAVPGGFYEDDGRSELEIHCPEHGGEAAQHGGEPSPASDSGDTTSLAAGNLTQSLVVVGHSNSNLLCDLPQGSEAAVRGVLLALQLDP
jgi:hypothetical protein